MTYIALVTALGIGYAIGLFQNGITINDMRGKESETPVEYNQSVGIPEYMDYHEETKGANKF